MNETKQQAGRMTKGERVELGQLIRKRERVMKSLATERGAKMLAEFDRQIAQVYKYDNDEVWKKVTEEAMLVVKKANEEIARRAAEIGIPEEFAPSLSFGWCDRGQNAVASRRSELRRVATSRIKAIEAETCTKIERLSLTAQTEVIANGLESKAARNFLDSMPSLDAMMPSLTVDEVERLKNDKDARRRMLGY